jgi:hypothetical protein
LADVDGEGLTGVLPAAPLSRLPQVFWGLACSSLPVINREPNAKPARPETLRPRLAAGLPCSVVGDCVEKRTQNRTTGISEKPRENFSPGVENLSGLSKLLSWPRNARQEKLISRRGDFPDSAARQGDEK